MEWKTEFSLGILEIDNQHKGLLRCFTDIEGAMALKKSWSDIHFGIVELKRFAQQHFSFEESMMRLFGYLGTEAHREEHEQFFVNLSEIERHSLRNEDGMELVGFLQAWLTDHILGTDRDYAKHILSGAAVIRSGTSAGPVMRAFSRDRDREDTPALLHQVRSATRQS